MRLLTAIPLLLMAGTAAMAQLAVLWSSEPAAATAVTQTSSDAELHSHPVPEVAQSAGAPEWLFTDVAIQYAPDPEPRQPQMEAKAPLTRLLAAVRLLANPPPSVL